MAISKIDVVKINNSFIGTNSKQNILVTKTKVIKIDDTDSLNKNYIPEIGGDEFEQHFAPLNNLEVPQFPQPSNPHLIAFKGIASRFKTTGVPWQEVLGLNLFKKELEGLITWVREKVLDLESDYYTNVYKPTQKVFDSLNGCDGIEAPKYVRINSLSGRMKIENGFNILKLEKEKRRELQSSYGKDGELYYLDYSFLEPLVLLNFLAWNDEYKNSFSKNGIIFEENKELKLVLGRLPLYVDLYLSLANECGINGVTRDDIKTVILSCLYGASFETIMSQMGNGVDKNLTRNLFDYVQKVFCIQHLKRNLIEEAKRNNGVFITNMFGKKLFLEDGIDDYKLPNRFVQSSAVDVAMLGFLNIVRSLKTHATLKTVKIKPAFIIHDAIILDVHNSAVNYLPDIVMAGIKNIPGIVIQNSLSLKITKLKES